jgi:hypothetical protein
MALGALEAVVTSGITRVRAHDVRRQDAGMSNAGAASACDVPAHPERAGGDSLTIPTQGVIAGSLSTGREVSDRCPAY